MNMIQFDPKEGTTGFWGLRDYPNIKQYGDIPYFESHVALCKSNRLEIVNPEVERICWENDTRINNPISLYDWKKVILIPGDIFDLPEGWGFEEKANCSDCPITDCPADTCPKKVLRLVPLTVKEENINDELIENILMITDDPRRDYSNDDKVTEQLSKLLNTKSAVKEEAEESQTDLWEEVRELLNDTTHDYFIRTVRERFTIQRKKP